MAFYLGERAFDGDDHQFMSNNFRAKIACALQQFSNNEFSLQFYDDMAWDGLLGTDAWDYADQNEIGANRNDSVINERPQQCSR